MLKSNDKKVRKIAEEYGQSIGIHFFKVKITYFMKKYFLQLDIDYSIYYI
jgi:hypothetical protein